MFKRGRDHGLPSYTEYAYKVCGLGNSPYPSSFEELKPRISKMHILEGLRRVYGHPGNIDLFTGGILEVYYQKLEDQTYRISLSRIICENSDNITKVPENAFIRPNRKQDLIDCSRVSRLNLAVWKEAHLQVVS
ncbi:unnamed protein product [Heterobilharzia americana]|nr:unnamed protein product [Heterobilharzia americana]